MSLCPTESFNPAFRLSVIDIIVLLAGGTASAYAFTVDWWLGIAIAFVVSHFFFFCNVLRMTRKLELIWAGIFAGLAIASIYLNLLSRPAVLMISAGVTLIVAIIETRRASYHGVGWRVLNPRLPEWWQAVVGDRRE